MLDKDQLGIVRGSVAALAVVVAAIGGGYIWVSPQWFGLTNGMAMSDQIAFALKADPPLFLWSALCVPVVSKKKGPAGADPSARGRPSRRPLSFLDRIPARRGASIVRNGTHRCANLRFCSGTYGCRSLTWLTAPEWRRINVSNINSPAPETMPTSAKLNAGQCQPAK